MPDTGDPGPPGETGDSFGEKVDSGDTARDTGGPPPALGTRLGLCDGYDVTPAKTVEELASAEGDLALLRDLGMGLMRPHRPAGHVFSQNVVAPEGLGSADWSLPDHVVATSAAAGVQLLVTLYPVALLDSEQPQQASVAPKDMPAWEAFVAAVVERYDGDGVDDMPGLALPVYAWEIGNEPYCDAGDEACAAALLELTRASWLAAHAADPEAMVLVGGARPALVAPGDPDEGTIGLYRWFFEQGGGAYTDAFGFHVMTGIAEPPVEGYLEIWRAVAGDTPLWLTEVGVWRAQEGVPSLADDPLSAAAWTTRTLDAAFAGGVEHALWCKARHDLATPPEVYAALRDWIAARPR